MDAKLRRVSTRILRMVNKVRRLIRLGRAKRVQKTRRMRRVLQESLKPKMMRRKGIETVVPREAETRPSK